MTDQDRRDVTEDQDVEAHGSLADRAETPIEESGAAAAADDDDDFEAHGPVQQPNLY